MLLHQINNSYNTKLFEIFLYRNYPYEPHLHRAYEFIYVLEGKLDVTVQKNSFELSAGSCCLIAPYHIHSFSGEAVFSIVTFSGSYVASFTKHFEQYVSDLPCFSLSPHTDLYFRKSFLGDVVLTKKAMNLPDPPAMVIKSVLYGLCAEYAQKCPLRERSSKRRHGSWIC
ncbi:MAG: AraC family ligand binding domain-containing protein [Clostridia bacterium]|nr:AraC family ligand binding domain-containing protein [Clostridia bacterium]